MELIKKISEIILLLNEEDSLLIFALQEKKYQLEQDILKKISITDKEKQSARNSINGYIYSLKWDELRENERLKKINKIIDSNVCSSDDYTIKKCKYAKPENYRDSILFSWDENNLVCNSCTERIDILESYSRNITYRIKEIFSCNSIPDELIELKAITTKVRKKLNNLKNKQS